MADQIPLVNYLVLGDKPHLVANECASCGARYFDRHPDEIARLHQALVDEVLRPGGAEHLVVATDIGIEVGRRV